MKHVLLGAGYQCYEGFTRVLGDLDVLKTYCADRHRLRFGLFRIFQLGHRFCARKIIEIIQKEAESGQGKEEHRYNSDPEQGLQCIRYSPVLLVTFEYILKIIIFADDVQTAACGDRYEHMNDEPEQQPLICLHSLL